jgi:hypothetical protein
MGVRKNSIYHPADLCLSHLWFAMDVDTNIPIICVWNKFMYKNCKHIDGGNHLGCIKKL